MGTCYIDSKNAVRTILQIQIYIHKDYLLQKNVARDKFKGVSNVCCICKFLLHDKVVMPVSHVYSISRMSQHIDGYLVCFSLSANPSLKCTQLVDERWSKAWMEFKQQDAAAGIVCIRFSSLSLSLYLFSFL